MADVEKQNKKRAAGASEQQSSKRRKNEWKRQQGLEKYKRGSSRAAIENGDSGIFVTCDRGRERKCIAEMLDLLSAFAPQDESKNQADASDGEDDDDIEAQIRKETEDMKSGKDKSKTPFQAVNLDVQCLTFIKLGNELDPVQIVHTICRSAQSNSDRKVTRWVKRMTPITRVRKILGGGLDEVAREVLEPHFHSGGVSKKFAIRPTIRNNTTLTRDNVITTVARAVGPGHTVDLKNYDLLILVDIVQSVCGMSVVGSDYEGLKRYNLSEIFTPTPRPQQIHDAPKEPQVTEKNEPKGS